MKDKIHPQYFKDCQISCSCGNSFTTGATQQTLKVEVCSQCHPFFSGQHRIIDTAGQVERFRKRFKIKE